jgi:hypothetical protein
LGLGRRVLSVKVRVKGSGFRVVGFRVHSSRVRDEGLVLMV